MVAGEGAIIPPGYKKLNGSSAKLVLNVFLRKAGNENFGTMCPMNGHEKFPLLLSLSQIILV